MGDEPEMINLTLSSSPVTAGTRKMRARWSPELAQDLIAFRYIPITEFLLEEMVEILVEKLKADEQSVYNKNIEEWINL